MFRNEIAYKSGDTRRSPNETRLLLQRVERLLRELDADPSRPRAGSASMTSPRDPSPAIMLVRIVKRFGSADNPGYAWVGVVPNENGGPSGPVHVNDDLDLNAYDGGYDASFSLAYERSKNRYVPCDGSAIVELHQSLDGAYYWFDWPEGSITARITGRDGAGKYSWSQVVPDNSGGWETPGSYGLTGDQAGINFAREYGGATAVPIGSIVRLDRGYSYGAPSGVVTVATHGDDESIACVQELYLAGWCAEYSSATWKATVWGKGGTIETIGPLSPTISAADLKTALDAVSGVTIDTVTGTGTEANPWVVTFGDFHDYQQIVIDPMGLVGQQEWWFAGSARGSTSVLTQACLTSKHSYGASTGTVTTSGVTALDVVTLALTVSKLAQFTAYGVVELEESAASVSGDVFAVSLLIDGAADAVQARYRARSGTPYAVANVAQQWRFTLAAGSHTLKLQVQRTSGTGTISATANSTLSVHADDVLTVQTTPIATAASGNSVCVDNPAGCCSPSSDSGSSGSGGAEVKTYDGSSCSEVGITSITIPGVEAKAGYLMLVDFVAGTSLPLALTATFDGSPLNSLTSSAESGTALPVRVDAFYLVISADTTGDVVVNWSSGTIPVAARVTLIPNCSNAPYGTSGGYGSTGTPVTGTLGGANTLPGYVHAAFVLSAPSGSESWGSPFAGEAADLDFCTDYRLATGGVIASSESETFTASLAGVAQTAFAGYECYLLGGPKSGGGGSGGDYAPVACCDSSTPAVLYAKPTGLSACDALPDGEPITLTYQSDTHDPFGNVKGAGWYSSVYSCAGGPNVYFFVQCLSGSLKFYTMFSDGSQSVLHSSTPTAVCSPFDYVANFSAVLPGGSWSGSTSWSVEYKGVSW